MWLLNIVYIAKYFDINVVLRIDEIKFFCFHDNSDFSQFQSISQFQDTLYHFQKMLHFVIKCFKMVKNDIVGTCILWFATVSHRKNIGNFMDILTI